MTTTSDTSSDTGRPIPPSGITRAGDAAPRVGKGRLKTAATAAAAGFRPKRREVGLFYAAPQSLHELYKDATSGSWMPGEQHPWLEALGKAWGLTIGLGGSAVLYGLAWLIQRPARSLATVAFAAAFTLALIWPWG